MIVKTLKRDPSTVAQAAARQLNLWSAFQFSRGLVEVRNRTLLGGLVDKPEKDCLLDQVYGWSSDGQDRWKI